MATVVVTLTDNEDGSLSVAIESDPEITEELFEARELTEAQVVAMLLIQDLVTDELGKQSSEKFDQGQTAQEGSANGA